MSFLTQLDALIKQRKDSPKPGSYTAKLLNEPLDRTLKKIGEEAGEFIIASKNNDVSEIANEAADLLFHMMVTLRHHNLSLEDVISVLKDRHNT